jgi:hypothetical protein
MIYEELRNGWQAKCRNYDAIIAGHDPVYQISYHVMILPTNTVEPDLPLSSAHTRKIPIIRQPPPPQNESDEKEQLNDDTLLFNMICIDGGTIHKITIQTLNDHSHELDAIKTKWLSFIQRTFGSPVKASWENVDLHKYPDVILGI